MLPTAESALEPLGRSASVDLRNVPSLCDTHTLFQHHRFYKWFKFNEKDSPEAESIKTSKNMNAKISRGMNQFHRYLHTKFLEHL